MPKVKNDQVSFVVGAYFAVNSFGRKDRRLNITQRLASKRCIDGERNSQLRLRKCYEVSEKSEVTLLTTRALQWLLLPYIR